MGPEAYADVRAAVHDPATVHAMVCDYRAGLRIDRKIEEEDRAAGRKITCPALYCWATRDDMEELYGDPAAIWGDWAADLEAAPIDSGHHMAEENPSALAGALRRLTQR
jgi:haloacetate dehalogenase